MTLIPQASIASSLGCCEKQLKPVDGEITLHRDVIKPWQQLVTAAKKEGFDINLASGYRSFERQRMIWNAKLSGQRPVLDDNGCALRLDNLTAMERIQCVMRWSALPGASRHHWGTDMDIYDKSAVSDDYQLQLTLDEYCDGGPFTPMMTWLKGYLESESAPDFFFPYQKDLGGVHPEPWHLSYRPVAKQFQSLWSLSDLLILLEKSELVEKETVIKNLETIYERYIVPSLQPE